jgi:hypothetical protein
MTGVASVASLAAFVAVPLGLGAMAGLATADETRGGWYASLRKPWFQPPAAVFGPVWTVLYVLMGVASWLAWRAGAGMGWYAVQLALNVAWTFVFFKAHAVRWALANIAALWLAIAATMASFWAKSPAAGALLVPYLAWVTFAASLNAGIAALNPAAPAAYDRPRW